MNASQATAIIDEIRAKYNFGLLEMLEIMSDEYQAGGSDYFQQVYTAKEREAYWTLAEGFRKLFHGA